MSTSDFRELTADGQIHSDTLVWHEGMENWQTYSQLPAADRPLVTETCDHCQGLFATTRMLTITDRRVCYRCKPYYVQMIKEIGFVRKQRHGTFGNRVMAALLDLVFVSIGSGVCFTGALIVGGMIAAFAGMGELMGVASAIGGGLALLFPYAYFCWFVGRKGSTPGKLVFNLKVVGSDGSKIGYGRALARAGATTVSALLLGIPWFVAAFDEDGLAIHDRICNTKHIKSK